MKEISIIIPAKNEEAALPEMLGGIKRIFSKSDYEIILVDGHSTDNTREVAKESGCRVILETGNRSPANAKNIGIAEAKGKIIIFFNSDVIPCGSFLKNIMAEKDWDALYCTETTPYDTFTEHLFALRSFSNEYTKSPIIYKSYVFKKIKFDGGLALGEEDDLFSNFIKNGFTAKKSGALVKSHIPHTLNGVGRQLRWYGRTCFNAFRKNRSPFNFFLISYILLPFIMAFPNPAFLISLPMWIYEAYIIAKSLTKKHDPVAFLFPAFDVFRSAFFIKGMLEYMFGTKRVGR